jgi:hypothetical protein
MMQLFQQMQGGMSPNKFTFVQLIHACAGLEALKDGRHVHEQSGWYSDVFVETSLIDMYAKCWSMEDAWDIFNKIPSHYMI